VPFSRGTRQSASAHGRGLPELKTRLLWLTVFRLVANSLSLGAIYLRLIEEAPRELSPGDMAGIVTVGLIYGLSLAYSIRLRFGEVGRNDAVVQLAGDILIATALVLITGGAESRWRRCSSTSASRQRFRAA
jgi:two-component system sensor histidine kinase PilS (NtrC family)